MVITDGDMIKLDEFVRLYRLKESKEYGVMVYALKSNLLACHK